MFGFMFVASCLMVAMFATRQMMLGFPAAIFWFLGGGAAFLISSTAWDIYFIAGFGSILGMGVFSMYAAYDLNKRNKKNMTLGEDEDEGKYIDEAKQPEVTEPEYEDEFSRRSRAIHERAKNRANRYSQASSINLKVRR